MMANLIFSLILALLFAVIACPYYTLIPRLRDKRDPLWSNGKTKKDKQWGIYVYPSDYPSVKSVCSKWGIGTASIFAVIFSINYFGSIDVLLIPAIVIETFFGCIFIGNCFAWAIDEYAPDENYDYRALLLIIASIASVILCTVFKPTSRLF